MTARGQPTAPDGWRQALDEGLEGVIKFELAAEDLVKDEASLMRAWLVDDARSAGHYITDLADELAMMEARAAQWLLGAANPVAHQWQILDLRLKHSSVQMVAGERPGGLRLICAQCGMPARCNARGELMVCGCGGEVFNREGLYH